MDDTNPKLYEVNLRPSRCLACGLSVCLVAVLAAFLLSALPHILIVFLLALTVCFLVRYGRQFIFLTHPYSIRTIRLIGDRWRVRTNTGWYQAWPEGDVVATSFLMCCRFKLEGERQPVFMILLPDSADIRELHGLRLKLMLDAGACLNPDNYPE